MLLKGHFCFLTMNIGDSEVAHTVALDHHTHSFGGTEVYFYKNKIKSLKNKLSKICASNTFV